MTLGVWEETRVSGEKPMHAWEEHNVHHCTTMPIPLEINKTKGFFSAFCFTLSYCSLRSCCLLDLVVAICHFYGGNYRQHFPHVLFFGKQILFTSQAVLLNFSSVKQIIFVSDSLVQVFSISPVEEYLLMLYCCLLYKLQQLVFILCSTAHSM